MRRQRRRLAHYAVTGINDGTVLSAYPIRKTPAQIMKRDGARMDEDGVCQEFLSKPVGAIYLTDPGRFRFFDIIANRLNTRRAIREIALPEIKALRDEVAELRSQVARLIELVSDMGDA